MASTLVRGKYVICKITGSSSSEVITDGAVFQRDGEIIEVGRYDDLKTRYAVDEIIGSSNQLVMPGLVNSHFHVGISPLDGSSGSIGCIDSEKIPTSHPILTVFPFASVSSCPGRIST